jgi:hypothetical protein
MSKSTGYIRVAYYTFTVEIVRKREDNLLVLTTTDYKEAICLFELYLTFGENVRLTHTVTR